MRKIQKLLIGVFIGGVLLSGIGTGMAFVEYSTLSYGGQKIIGEENLVTKTLTYELSEDHNEVIILENYSYWTSHVTEVVEDPEVSKREIQYEITYNEKMVRPFLWTDESLNSETKKIDTVRIGLSIEYFGDEFGEFMKNKDMVLNELKQNKISSYVRNHVTDVVIRIHPDTMDLVESHY